MASSFKTIVTGDQKLDRIQQNISNALNSITGPFLGGNLITGVSLVSGTALAINHGLGRQPQLWVLADINAAATVFRKAWDTNSLTLQASANCTISIWVN